MGEVSRAKQLVDAYERLQKPVISLVEVPEQDVSKYGIVEVESAIDSKILKLKNIVEKPTVEQAPSNLASVGGYILTPDILTYLDRQKPDSSGEIYLSSALQEYAQNNELYGLKIDGNWHDTGNKEKYLEAIMDVALADPKLAGVIYSYIEKYRGKSNG